MQYNGHVLIYSEYVGGQVTDIKIYNILLCHGKFPVVSYAPQGSFLYIFVISILQVSAMESLQNRVTWFIWQLRSPEWFVTPLCEVWKPSCSVFAVLTYPNKKRSRTMFKLILEFSNSNFIIFTICQWFHH